jgi:hypothetical protein
VATTYEIQVTIRDNEWNKVEEDRGEVVESRQKTRYWE